MDLSDAESRLVAALRHGLPLVPEPYRVLGEVVGMTEAEVVASLRRLNDGGAVSRFGVVVNHGALGYTANAMVVWDMPDARVDDLGERMGAFPGVNLCYRRPRRPPEWPYNLFTMIHGRDRATVRAVVDGLIAGFALHDVRHELLFTARRYKQSAALYGTPDRD